VTGLGDRVFRSGGAQIRVEGLGKTLRALERAGADARDMRDAMHRLGSIVVQVAQPHVPVKSGRTRSTLRAGRGKTKAVVRMGGARAKYAPVVHYGWPARGIAPNPSLVRAYQSAQGRIFAQLDAELERLLANRNLT